MKGGRKEGGGGVGEKTQSHSSLIEMRFYLHLSCRLEAFSISQVTRQPDKKSQNSIKTIKIILKWPVRTLKCINNKKLNKRNKEIIHFCFYSFTLNFSISTSQQQMKER